MLTRTRQFLLAFLLIGAALATLPTTNAGPLSVSLSEGCQVNTPATAASSVCVDPDEPSVCIVSHEAVVAGPASATLASSCQGDGAACDSAVATTYVDDGTNHVGYVAGYERCDHHPKVFAYCIPDFYVNAPPPVGPLDDSTFYCSPSSWGTCAPDDYGFEIDALVDAAPCLAGPIHYCSDGIGIVLDTPPFSECHDLDFCPPPTQGIVLDSYVVCDPMPTPCPGGSVGVTSPACFDPCPAGQVGLVIDGTPQCHTVDPCPPPTYGISVDGSPTCHTFTTCTPPNVGVVIDGTPLCESAPPISPCAAPNYGVQGPPPVGNQCHTIDPCTPPATVGAKVDGIGACLPVPGGCPAGKIGVSGPPPVGSQCHTVDSCSPPSTVGAKVDGIGACIPAPTPCSPPGSVGVNGPPPVGNQCHTVDPCSPPATIGAKVDGNGICIPAPTPCPAPTYGVQGPPPVGNQCHSVAPCAPPAVGVVVDGSDHCITAGPCPPGSYGVIVNSLNECHTILVCTAPDVGVIVDGNGSCTTPPALCNAPYVGVVGPAPIGNQCHTMVSCPFPSVGVIVDGAPTCHTVELCPAPTVGVLIDGSGDCHTVDPCSPPSSVGVIVDGTGSCTPAPALCNAPQVGIEGPEPIGSQCHDVAFCPAPSVGVIVDGTPECHTVSTCSPPTTFGVQVDGQGTCVAPPSTCPAGTVGVSGPAPVGNQCHTISTCNPGSGSWGVVIAGPTINQGSCGPLPALCNAPSVGVQGGPGPLANQCYSVSTCDPSTGSWGVVVSGPSGPVGSCGPLPSLCNAPAFGVQGLPSPIGDQCHTVANCDDPAKIGVKIDSDNTACLPP